MAEVFTISFTLHPRLRSKNGFLRPWTTGPIASAFPRRCAILYPIFPALRSGKINTFALPATAAAGCFSSSD